MILLRDLDSKQYRVDSQLAEGGEGVICTLVGKPELVVKLYKPNQRTAEREAKLLAMLEAPPPDEMLAKFKHASISWPVSVVREESGGFAGFLMPRINAGYGLINAYNPHAAKFLKFNWHEQHQVAANLCAALHSLHVKGYVVGDVNERNILVTKNGLVTLVDTDSFQVQRQDGRIFRCGVGVPEYTPAELHGKAFDQVDRLPQHDNFGLAVLIFRLLMRGQHPFNAAQKDLSLSVGKVDEYCIRSGIFPWLEHPQFTRPPSAKDLDVLHSGLQILFGQAFVIGHKHPQLRPTAIEWLRALDTAKGKLTRCGTGAHWLQTGRLCGDCRVRVPLPPQPLPPSQPSTPLPPPLMVSLRSFVALLVSKRWGWATALGLFWLVYTVSVSMMDLKQAQRELANKQEYLNQARRELASKQASLEQARQELTNKQASLEQAQRELASKQAASRLPVTSVPNAVTLVVPSTVSTAFEPEMVDIPAGSFDMGSPSNEAGRRDYEGPVHTVHIKAFRMGKYEITNAQFRKFRPEHNSGDFIGHSLNGDNQPVVNVSWADAVAYAEWLAKETGKPYRLPSEAEWEYAARAGTTTSYYWGNEIDPTKLNFSDKNDPSGSSREDLDDGYAVSAPVGSYSSNPWGLYDMLGNVWEWNQDKWHSNYDGAPTDGSAWESGDSSARLLRGCSWLIKPGYCRAAYRNGSTAPNSDRGFRVVFRVAGRAF